MHSTSLIPSLLLAAAGAARAGVVLTSPIATSNWTAGEREQVKWDDDGESPSLKDMGMVQVDLYTGSQLLQTYLATLNTVAATEGVANVQIPKGVGPDGQFYFVRVHAAKEEDRTKDAFSAVFTLEGANGKFNETVKSEIAAVSSSSAAAASASSKSAGGLTATGGAPPAGSTSAPASPSDEGSAGSRLVASGAVAVVAGAAAFLL